ncbi:MAG: hypothetical protein ACK5U8_14065 [Deltaproteobacteria bacterium]|jgi:hypothetical protein
MNTMSRCSSVGLLCGLLALGCGGGGGVSAEPSGGQTGGGESAEPSFPMPLAQFLGLVTAEVLPDLCSEASPLRTCYPGVEQETCATAFSTAMMSCGENMQGTLPAEVAEGDAEATATAVATCARIAYQLGLEQAGAARAADCALER